MRPSPSSTPPGPRPPLRRGALRLTPGVACLALPLLAGACGPDPPPAGGNLLLVTVDTLRADHLGAWGDTRVDTPALDAWARESLVFEEATTAIPITTPSLATVLTSRLPRNTGVLNNSYDLRGYELLLSEALQGSGYATGAFLPTFLANKEGFKQGFDLYRAPATPAEPALTGPEVLSRARTWLESVEDANGGPWFAWVHLIEPHSPYAPPADLEAKYLPAGTGPIDAELRNEAHGRHLERTPKEVEIVRALYRAEVEATDRALAPLIDWLREHAPGGTRAEHGRVVTLFTADHGELLYEHERYIGHTSWLFEEMLRIPFLIHFTSGFLAGERSAHPASTVDVMPTLLAVAGVPFQSPDGGVDLLRHLGRVERTLVHETFAPEGFYDQQAVRDGVLKLHRPVVDEPESRARLYDLARDRRERSDLASGEAAVVDRLEAFYRDWEAVQGDPHHVEKPVLSEETRAYLESLGYIQGDRPAVDPREGAPEGTPEGHGG